MGTRVISRGRKPRRWDMAEVYAAVGTQPRSTVTDKGSVANRDRPESGRVDIDDFTTITLVWDGKFSALAAVQPAKGDVYLAYANKPVMSSSLVPRRGDLATLTVILSDRVEEAGETASELKERYEIEWRQIEKELIQHPYIADDAGVAEIIEDVELWRNGDIKLRAAYKYVDTDEAEKSLAGKALAVATKMQRGQTGYLVFAPAVRRVRDYQGRPDTGACGTIDTPAVSIEGYSYLKTADRLVQQADDVWQRTEEWTGADSWDADLYTSGSGWNA